MNADFQSLLVFHKLVIVLKLLDTNVGNYMKGKITNKVRKELEAKMAMVFQENIKCLSTDLQEILVDDMVTAFENRLNVLNVVATKSCC